MKKVLPVHVSTRPVLLGASLIGVITLGLTACGRAATPAPGGGAATPSASSAPAKTHTSVPPAPSAATQLAAFFAAAEEANGKLHHAAALVNGDIGATSMRYAPATLAAVRALSVIPAGRAIPAGLPTGLLRDVLVVYGDLDSRTAAFGGVEMYGSSGRELPISGPEAKAVLHGLHNGAPAAARFSGDLATARSLARQTPAVTIPAPDSRPAAELALRMRSISIRNGCAEEFGGFAPTSLEAVIWRPAAGQHPGHYEGTIGGIRFQADYTAQHAWKIIIYAC